MRGMRLAALIGVLFATACAIAAATANAAAPAALRAAPAALRAVPSGDAAIAAGVPITVASLDHWMYVAAKANATKADAVLIVPTDPPRFDRCIARVRAKIPAYRRTSRDRLRSDCTKLFDDLSRQALGFLISSYWYETDAAQLGLTPSAAEVSRAYRQTAREIFPTPRALRQFLAQSGETVADIYFRVKVDLTLQRLIDRRVKPVTRSEELAYYRRHRRDFPAPFASLATTLHQLLTARRVSAATRAVNRSSRIDWLPDTACRAPYASTDCVDDQPARRAPDAL